MVKACAVTVQPRGIMRGVILKWTYFASWYSIEDPVNPFQTVSEIAFSSYFSINICISYSYTYRLFMVLKFAFQRC